MSNFNLAKEARKLAMEADKLLKGKEYFLGDIVTRFQAAAKKFPHDQAIRNAEKILFSKMEKVGKAAIVDQSDVQFLYDNLGGLGNKEAFKQELGDLLLSSEIPKVANYNAEFIGGLRDSGDSLELVSKEHVEKIATIFGSDTPSKALAGTYIEKGKRGVVAEFEALGYPEANVEVAGHDQNFVIYAVELQGKKGRMTIAVPAEIRIGSVLLPSTFVSGNEFVDLNKENLQNWINNFDKIGKTAAPKAILDTLNRWIKKGSEESLEKMASDVSDVSDIMPHGQMFYMSHIGHTKEVSEPIDVKTAAVPLPDSLKGIGESIIGDILVEAGLSYPKNVVSSAKNVVSQVIKSAGYDHDRIVVEAEFDGGITFGTNLVCGQRKKIEIPVEISGEQVLMPSAFVSGGYAGKFDPSGLKTFAARSEQTAFDAMLTHKADMSFAELHKLTLLKTSQGNMIEATETLDLINQKFGHGYHKIAHDDMMGLLRAGYSAPEKPLSAMEVYAKQAEKAAKARSEMIKVDSSARFLYPSFD
jgi:hypothetical protein